jgi:hypothetical protein
MPPAEVESRQTLTPFVSRHFAAARSRSNGAMNMMADLVEQCPRDLDLA